MKTQFLTAVAATFNILLDNFNTTYDFYLFSIRDLDAYVNNNIYSIESYCGPTYEIYKVVPKSYSYDY